MDIQKAFTSGNRKALLTRVNARTWLYRVGFSGDLELKDGGRTHTRRLAMNHIKGWLKDAREI